MGEAIIVITNTSTQQEALQIAREAVDRHLAASINISGPITSVYRWQGKVETAEEWQCFIKTSRERYSELEQLIHDFHSYELPGILALPVPSGSASYLRWIGQETQYVVRSSGGTLEDEAISKNQLIQNLLDAHQQLIEVAIEANQYGMIRDGGDIWGPREVLAHIAGWEVMAAVRIPKIVAGIPPLTYLSEEQHNASDDNINATIIAMIGNQSFDEVCQLLREAYQRDVQMLRSLDESFFDQNSYVNLRINAAIEHCHEHIEKLKISILERKGVPGDRERGTVL